MPTDRPFEDFLPALLSHPLIAERAYQQFGTDAAEFSELFDLIHDTAHNLREVAPLP